MAHPSSDLTLLNLTAAFPRMPSKLLDWPVNKPHWFRLLVSCSLPHSRCRPCRQLQPLEVWTPSGGPTIGPSTPSEYRRSISPSRTPQKPAFLSAPQGARFDPDLPQTIRLEFAKSNTKVSKPKPQVTVPPPHPALVHPAFTQGRKYTAAESAELLQQRSDRVAHPAQSPSQPRVLPLAWCSPRLKYGPTNVSTPL